MLCEISKGTFEISHNIFEPIHHKICILLFCIFACELRYLWIMTSLGLVRRVPGCHDGRGYAILYSLIMVDFGQDKQGCHNICIPYFLPCEYYWKPGYHDADIVLHHTPTSSPRSEKNASLPQKISSILTSSYKNTIHDAVFCDMTVFSHKYYFVACTWFADICQSAFVIQYWFCFIFWRFLYPKKIKRHWIWIRGGSGSVVPQKN